MAGVLTEYRKALGLTQAKLAEISNVSRVCISRYETGKYQPSIRNATKLANALSTTVDVLIARCTSEANQN